MTTHLLPLVVNAGDTDNVRPGWIALLVVLALGAFVVFLYFSMKKQLGRIDFDEDGEKAGSEDHDGAAPTP